MGFEQPSSAESVIDDERWSVSDDHKSEDQPESDARLSDSDPQESDYHPEHVQKKQRTSLLFKPKRRDSILRERVQKNVSVSTAMYMNSTLRGPASGRQRELQQIAEQPKFSKFQIWFHRLVTGSDPETYETDDEQQAYEQDGEQQAYEQDGEQDG